MFACDAHGNSNPVVNADSVKKAIFERTLPTTAHKQHNVFYNISHQAAYIASQQCNAVPDHLLPRFTAE
jgi:hypothetical protein